MSKLNHHSKQSFIKALYQIKRLIFGNYDESMRVLVEFFKFTRGISDYESNEHITFSLPRSPIKPSINITFCISLKKLIYIASYISKPHLTKSTGSVIKLIKNISEKDLNLLNGLDLLLSELTLFNKDFDAFECLVEESYTPPPYSII
jgi:hypothetical protein